MKRIASIVLAAALLPAACDRPAPPPAGGVTGGAPTGSTSGSAAPTPAPQGPAANPASAPVTAPAPGGQPLPTPTAGPGDNLSDLSSPTFTLAGVMFTTPEGWKRSAPSNSMRLAELRIPAPSGETADDCVAAFTQAGGAVKMNIDRWKTQILTDGKPTDGTTETTEVAGIKTTVFTATGTYQDGMPGGAKTPREKWTLRAAILETPGYLTFIKMTGPESAMTASKPAWDAMLKSARKP